MVAYEPCELLLFIHPWESLATHNLAQLKKHFQSDAAISCIDADKSLSI